MLDSPITTESCKRCENPTLPDSRQRSHCSNPRARLPEVLDLMVQGLTNRKIADWLFIAVGTVKRHINNIYGKLEVHHRAEAIARARKLGLLS